MKEQKIRRDLEDGLDPQRAERITVNDVFDSYIKQKYDLKPTTRVNYIYTYAHFIRETFGKRKLSKVRYTDVKEFYYSLIVEQGLSPTTVDNVHTQLHPAFTMAVRNGLIRTNPASGVLNTSPNYLLGMEEYEEDLLEIITVYKNLKDSKTKEIALEQMKLLATIHPAF